MPRGTRSEVGETRVADNGYHWTRTEDGWVMTHHLLAVKKLGRPLNANEMVRFVNKKARSNPTVDDIEIITKNKASARRRLAQVEARIEELMAERDALREEIGELALELTSK